MADCYACGVPSWVTSGFGARGGDGGATREPQRSQGMYMAFGYVDGNLSNPHSRVAWRAILRWLERYVCLQVGYFPRAMWTASV